MSELEAARMILVTKPEKKAQESGSPMFQELKGICMSLGMSKPPVNITMFQFFSGIEKKVGYDVLPQDKAEHLNTSWPAFVTPVSHHWLGDRLNYIQELQTFWMPVGGIVFSSLWLSALKDGDWQFGV